MNLIMFTEVIGKGSRKLLCLVLVHKDSDSNLKAFVFVEKKPGMATVMFVRNSSDSPLL